MFISVSDANARAVQGRSDTDDAGDDTDDDTDDEELEMVFLGVENASDVAKRMEDRRMLMRQMIIVEW